MGARQEMLLDRLLVECTLHYRDRGFPESALMHLRWVLITNTHDDQIRLHTAYQDCDKPVAKLLGHFKRCPSGPDQGDLTSAHAIFGFAFGYRLNEWPIGVASADPGKAADLRLPGANNEALAKQALQLHLTHQLDLYLQFEIADAIRVATFDKYSSRRVDQGTAGVLNEFVCHAANIGKAIHAVVVVAHRHHYDRCQLLLEKQGIRVIRPPELYSDYDPLEAQPRVMTPEENIINDFASMAGMA
jgi:hypothetical protein